MGLKRVNEIVEAAKLSGIRNDLPAAIVCNASRPNQKNIFATLGGLVEAANEAETPAIIIFGDVVDLPDILQNVNGGLTELA
jgi:siroheme synthase